MLLKKQLMDKLERELKFELPESLVTAEANSIAMQKNNDNKKSAAPDKKPNVTKEDKKIAERRVRVGLFFAEYGIENKLDLSEASLMQHMKLRLENILGTSKIILSLLNQIFKLSKRLEGHYLKKK